MPAWRTRQRLALPDMGMRFRVAAEHVQQAIGSLLRCRISRLMRVNAFGLAAGRKLCAKMRLSGLTSRPEGFHLQALPEPYVNLSIHTAPDVRPLP